MYCGLCGIYSSDCTGKRGLCRIEWSEEKNSGHNALEAVCRTVMRAADMTTLRERRCYIVNDASLCTYSTTTAVGAPLLVWVHPICVTLLRVL